MKIIVDEMPNYPYECRNCRQEGDMEFHHWVCQVGEEKHICKDVKDCPWWFNPDLHYGQWVRVDDQIKKWTDIKNKFEKGA